MGKDRIVDLTSLLDVILIILFAVMLNMNQSAESAISTSSDLEASIQTFQESETLLEEELVTTTHALEDSKDDLKELNETYAIEENLLSKQIETNELIIEQYKQLITQLNNLLETDTDTINDILENQDLTSEEITAILSTVIDTNILTENLHKYQVISNTFDFIDLSLNVEDGNLIYNDISSSIYITTEDGFDDHLFQIKRDELVTYFIKQIEESNIHKSFILITIKINPYTTAHFYITMLSEAIDTLRENYQDVVIFDTTYYIDK